MLSLKQGWKKIAINVSAAKLVKKLVEAKKTITDWELQRAS